MWLGGRAHRPIGRGTWGGGEENERRESGKEERRGRPARPDLDRARARTAPPQAARCERAQKKLIPSLLSLTLQDTEALARKIAAAGGGRVELGEIKWR